MSCSGTQDPLWRTLARLEHAELSDSKNVGNCLNRYTCTKCGFSEVVDSSD